MRLSRAASIFWQKMAWASVSDLAETVQHSWLDLSALHNKAFVWRLNRQRLQCPFIGCFAPNLGRHEAAGLCLKADTTCGAKF